MSLINISQTVVSSFRRQIAAEGKEPKIERRSSERRNQADRRKEQRIGNTVDRRKKAERRSE